ncbi:hypothetical protein EC957_007866 [Mortierella hygrophila]|uniref:Galactose oxidase n=1 Tax=Mortierella hygrophila TaxID=979708 RepID=A0A9P6EY19_9FUNG|nr:hypothetical protein EC957_007866 [Mortierella hygrophila]
MTALSKAATKASTHLFLLVFTLILVLSTHTRHYTFAQTAPPFTPVPVWAPASVKTATRLFILSGYTTLTPAADTNIAAPTADQFFFLDLAKSWTSSAPAWTLVTPASTGLTNPQQVNFPGTSSSDQKKLYFFGISGPNSVYQFNLDTAQWSPANASFLEPTRKGSGAVTDPSTNLVYMAGGYSGTNLMNIWNPSTGQISNMSLPNPPAFPYRAYYANVYCQTRQSILYFGGTSSTIVAAYVTEFRPKQGTFTTLTTPGTAPSARADHCMAINDDSTKLIVFGGHGLPQNSPTSNEIFILDIPTLTWSSGSPSPQPHTYATCAIAGDQFIVWGGLYSDTQIASTDVHIYSITSNTWINQYTAPAAYQSLNVPPIPNVKSTTISSGPSGTGSANPSLVSETGTSQSSNIGGVVGGVVGGLAVIAAIVGFLFYRRRQIHRAPSPSDPGRIFGKEVTETRDSGRKPRNSSGLQEIKKHSPQAIVFEGARIPDRHQGPQALASESDNSSHLLDMRLKGIDNQLQQLELQRQQLVLEEQKAHLHMNNSRQNPQAFS